MRSEEFQEAACESVHALRLLWALLEKCSFAKVLRSAEESVEEEWAQAAGGVWWDEWEETEAEQGRKRRRTDDASTQVCAARHSRSITRDASLILLRPLPCEELCLRRAVHALVTPANTKWLQDCATAGLLASTAEVATVLRCAGRSGCRQGSAA